MSLVSKEGQTKTTLTQFLKQLLRYLQPPMEPVEAHFSVIDTQWDFIVMLCKLLFIKGPSTVYVI